MTKQRIQVYLEKATLEEFRQLKEEVFPHSFGASVLWRVVVRLGLRAIRNVGEDELRRLIRESK